MNRLTKFTWVLSLCAVIVLLIACADTDVPRATPKPPSPSPIPANTSTQTPPPTGTPMPPTSTPAAPRTSPPPSTAVGGSAQSPTPTDGTPPRANHRTQTKLGIHLLLDDGRNAWPTEVWARHLRFASQAVGNWGYATELIRSDDLDVAKWQYFMDLCAELHITPILRLATTYDTNNDWWRAPEPDADGSYNTLAAQYAEFIAGLSWPTSNHYVIVANEPNHGNEWSGRPDPVAYARFLIDVADAVHAADPESRILNAGLDPYTPHTGNLPFPGSHYYFMDEETFLDEMHAAYPDVFTRLDAWASHAYPHGPFTEGPWQQSFGIDMMHGASNPNHDPPPQGIHNRGINGYEWELFKLSTYGVAPLPVMITETGWRHVETTDPAATDNGRPLPTAETVAIYVDLAFFGNNGRYPDLPGGGWTPWADDPRVVAVTPFALDGHPSEWGHTNWLALDRQGAILGTYAPFELLATRSAQP